METAVLAAAKIGMTVRALVSLSDLAPRVNLLFARMAGLHDHIL
jgi:hypothetical protein